MMPFDFNDVSMAITEGSEPTMNPTTYFVELRPKPEPPDPQFGPLMVWQQGSVSYPRSGPFASHESAEAFAASAIGSGLFLSATIMSKEELEKRDKERQEEMKRQMQEAMKRPAAIISLPGGMQVVGSEVAMPVTKRPENAKPWDGYVCKECNNYNCLPEGWIDRLDGKSFRAACLTCGAEYKITENLAVIRIIYAPPYRTQVVKRGEQEADEPVMEGGPQP